MTLTLISALRVCAKAQWKHDESVQLGGFRSGGGEGPHPILIGLRHPEGGAACQSVPLRGHRIGTQEPLRPVSDSICESASCNNKKVT